VAVLVVDLGLHEFQSLDILAITVEELLKSTILAEVLVIDLAGRRVRREELWRKTDSMAFLVLHLDA
jgi:hypothetical protein